jgi:hypothetical protein
MISDNYLKSHRKEKILYYQEQYEKARWQVKIFRIVARNPKSEGCQY